MSGGGLRRYAKTILAALMVVGMCGALVPATYAENAAVETPNASAEVQTQAQPGDGQNAAEQQADAANAGANATTPAPANATDGTVVPNAFVTQVHLLKESTGTEPWDTAEGPGNDTSPGDDIVRSFDRVVYKLNVNMTTDDEKDPNHQSYTKATFGFEAKLPYGSKQIQWLTSDFYNVTTLYDQKDANGNVYSVVRGYYDVTSTDSKTPVLPSGSVQRALGVQVLGMYNGQTLEPEIHCWMKGGLDQPKDLDNEDGTPNYDATFDESRIIKDGKSVDTVKVSAQLRLNVVLTPTSASGYGTYDFSKGNDKAPNKDAGKRTGYLYGMGVGLQLRNWDLTRGMRGIELPDPNADIKLHIDFGTQVDKKDGNGRVDVPEGYEPLIYSVDANDGYRDSNAPNVDPYDGRSLVSEGGNEPSQSYASRVPGNNSDAKDNPVTDKNQLRYMKVEYGGEWSSTAKDASADITVSGARITDWLFPYSSLGYTNYTSYNPDMDWRNKPLDEIKQDVTKVQQAYFSAGKIWVVQPVYNKQDNGQALDENYMVQNGEWTGYLTATETLTSAYSISAPQAQGGTAITDADQIINKDTYVTDQDSLTKVDKDTPGAHSVTDDVQETKFAVKLVSGGGMVPQIRYIQNLDANSDVQGRNDGQSCWNLGCDYAVTGQDLAIAGSLNWNPGTARQNIASGMNLLIKYDADALETTGEIKMNEDPYVGNYDRGAWKARWGYLVDADGNERNWPSDDEMNQALENYAQDGLTLKWDATWQKGRKYVATLFEERDQFNGDADCVKEHSKSFDHGEAYEKNLRAATYTARVGVKVRSDKALYKTVHATMVYARVWTNSDVTANRGDVFPTAGDANTPYVPSVVDEDGADAVAQIKDGTFKTGSQKAQDGRDGKVAPYHKWVYDENGKGDGDNYTNRGDSLYIIPYLTKVSIKHAQTTKGDKDGTKEKDTYKVADGERTADFEIQPEIVQKTEGIPLGPDGKPIDQGATTVTVTATLPKEFTYIPDSSHYGGIYTPDSQEGFQGKVEGGVEINPTVTTNADGTTTLVWNIPDVPIKDGKVQEQWFNGGTGKYEYRDAKIRYSVKIGDEGDPAKDQKLITNGSSCITVVDIKTTEDNRQPKPNDAVAANEAKVTTKFIRGSSASFYKFGVQPSFELNQDVSWRTGVFNPTDHPQHVYLLDNMPYNGDEYGTRFDGEYYMKLWLAEDIKTEQGQAGNAGHYEVYYTTDTNYRGKSTQASDENFISEDEVKAKWTKAETKDEDGKFEAIFPTTDATGRYVQPVAWVVIGDQASKYQLDITITIHQNRPQSSDKFINSAKWNEFTQTGLAFRVARYVAGRVWIDMDGDGIQDKNCQNPDGSIPVGQCAAEGHDNNTEPKMPNAWVELKVLKDGQWVRAVDLDGNPIAPQQTSKQTGPDSQHMNGGYYRFDYLPQGKYRVYITHGNPDDPDNQKPEEGSEPFKGYKLTKRSVWNTPYDDWRNSKAEETDAGGVIDAIAMPSATNIYSGDFAVNYQDAGFYPASMPHSGAMPKWPMWAAAGMGLLMVGCWLLAGHRFGVSSTARHSVAAHSGR